MSPVPQSHTSMSSFQHLSDKSVDPIVELMIACAKDKTPEKIDVSVGVYMSEEGDPNHVFDCVAAAKKKLAANDPGHCYTQIAGIPEFISAAQRTIFGENHKNVTSVQAIAGSGALHLAFSLLRDVGYTDFYVGTPAWSNYQGMIENIGCNFKLYNYFNSASSSVDFGSILEALNSVPSKSVFVMQAVCHNPTGYDLSKDQWSQVFDAIKKNNHFLVFDIAYQGLGSGNLDEDAWAIREAYRQKMEFIVCQSFSKNLGLYSERAGCTHVCSWDIECTKSILSRLVAYIRNEVSFAPAFGARIATLCHEDEELNKIWEQDIKNVWNRLKEVRLKVFEGLTKRQTPGSWNSVLELNGLFWFSGMTAQQTKVLIDEYHIYALSNGRLNIAGLNNGNIDRFCSAMDDVVRRYPKGN